MKVSTAQEGGAMVESEAQYEADERQPHETPSGLYEPSDVMSNAMQAALAAVEALAREPTSRPGSAQDGDSTRAELQQTKSELAEARARILRLQGELEQAQGDVAATRRRFQRLDQELEEVRKRMQRSELELPVIGARTLAQALLPALDDLDAVLQHLNSRETLSSGGSEALAMLADRWTKALQDGQIQAFDTLGQRFDPMVHDVIAQVEDAEALPGTVVRQISRGYLHGGRLLRSARVLVSSTPE